MRALWGCRRVALASPAVASRVVAAGGFLRTRAGDALGTPAFCSGLSAASSSRQRTLGPHSDERSATPLAAVVADGWTPHKGVVTGKTAFGAFVDFGCEVQGLLPLRATCPLTPPERIARLRVGQTVEVYVAGKNAGKVSLSLVPRDRPHLRWDDIVADGRTPYEGRVMNIVDFGTFVDIGTELPGLLLPRCEGRLALGIGDSVTVYVRDKRRDSRKLSLSLKPEPSVRKSWDDLVADGCTPYEGTVQSMDPSMGVFVDLGFERCALMPVSENDYCSGSVTSAKEVLSLQVGSRVVVYVIRKQRKSRKLIVTLHKRMVPLTPFSDIVADGQTPREGVVMVKADYGAWVDIGCEAVGLLPVGQCSDSKEFESLAVGDRITTYVLTKSRDTGKIGLGLRRSRKPRERWAAIQSDGQTPYEGTITSVNWYGIYVDIGCERNARLTSAIGFKDDERLQRLKVGDQVTAYVIEKRSDTGKVMASIDPRETGLTRVEDLIVDGQTGYYGYVKSRNDLGVWVDIGSDRIGAIWRNYLEDNDVQTIDSLSVGDPLLVYIIRRNPANGRLLYALQPSPTPRLRVADVLASLGSTAYEGRVYCVRHESVHVDFGCEAAGVLSRADAPADCAERDVVTVRAVGYNAEKGRFELAGVAEARAVGDEATDVAGAAEMPSAAEAPAAIVVAPTASTAEEPAASAADAPAASAGEAPAEPAPSPPTPPAASSSKGANRKGELQNEVLKRLRRNLAPGDLVYTTERGADGHFLAHVEVVALPELAGQRFTGSPRTRKVEAEQSAAEQALARLSGSPPSAVVSGESGAR